MTDSPATDKDNRPVPDPTTLTTDALMREVANLKQLVFERIDRNAQVSEQKFGSIDKELQLNERQRVEQKKDTKDAVDAALTAQKEAVKEQTTASERAIAKSETSTTKSIEQLGEKFDTAFEGQRRETADLKDRINKTEGKTTGSEITVTKFYGAIAAVGTILAIIVLIANGIFR